jgi:hypothetical protein
LISIGKPVLILLQIKTCSPPPNQWAQRVQIPCRGTRGEEGGAVEEGYAVEEGCAATLFLAFTANIFIGARQGRGTCHFGAKPELATLLPHTVLGPREHLSTERAGDTGAYRVCANIEDTREERRLALVPCAFHGAWHV